MGNKIESLPALKSQERNSRFLSTTYFLLCFSDFCVSTVFLPNRRLVDLVVKAYASRAEDLGLCCGDFVGSSHTIDLTIGTPVATLPGA